MPRLLHGRRKKASSRITVIINSAEMTIYSHAASWQDTCTMHINNVCRQTEYTNKQRICILCFIWLLLKLKTVTVIEQILDISSLYFVLFKQGRLVIYYGAGKG